MVVDMPQFALKIILSLIVLVGMGGLASHFVGLDKQAKPPADALEPVAQEDDFRGGIELPLHPLSIEYLRNLEYPTSELIVEQTLSDGSNYSRTIVSYRSEGLKQYALLTIPQSNPPNEGFPAIIFNHGYIQPSVYRTTEKYISYLDGFARNGYVVLKPDYRGHGNSEGQAEGGYGSPGYTIDVLHALTSLQAHQSVNPEKIGMWGHSMGGHITLRSMVVNPDIKAGVIWGGVVGSYQDYQELWWNRRSRPTPTASPKPGQRGYWRSQLIAENGTYKENPEFWASISATTYLSDLGGPIQLHHARGDASVPYQLSEALHQAMIAAGQVSELYLYSGDDHNISTNFSQAISYSVAFFDTYLK